MSRAKEAAGRAAAEHIRDGMTVGLGTGSTVRFTLERLAERIRVERLVVRGVPTSLDTEHKARALGIPLALLEEVETIDLTIDGADEIDARFDMIKGGGGALLREKVVAALTKRELIVVDRSKMVERLGVRFPLPVEVVPFARAAVARRIGALGAAWTVRMRDGNEVARTDNGNEILDCRFPGGIADAAALERALDEIPGVVESGLFIGLAHTLVVADDDGRVEQRPRPAR
ncbi:MAG: ribose-5-phosphate isomerase RpiA [Planctomycetes bacterium]|nr:ribose-5-phosphate isomerase RpiA [Planctomycetota bacterium]